MILAVPSSSPDVPGTLAALDPASRAWLRRLRGTGADRDGAIGELHDLLMAAARHEVHRRAGGGRADLDDLARQSADDALVAILRKLDDFRGESRFTTWAYKFALLEAGVKTRRRAWQGREVPLEDQAWVRLADASAGAGRGAEDAELFTAMREEIERSLGPRQ